MIERVVVRVAKFLEDKGLVKEATEFERISWEPVEPRAVRSLACDVIVAAYGPGGGPYPSQVTAIDWMVRAALVVELRLEGRIAVSGSGRKTTATVRVPQALGDPELDIALRHLNSGGATTVMRKADTLPGTERVADRLLEEGVLVEESSTRFGVFTKTRVRPAPAAGREELVDGLLSVLRGGSVPDERMALLIAVIDEFIGFGSLVPHEQLEEARRAGEAVAAQVGEDYRALIDAVGFAEDDSKSSGDVSVT